MQIIAYNLCYSTCIGRPQHARAGTTAAAMKAQASAANSQRAGITGDDAEVFKGVKNFIGSWLLQTVEYLQLVNCKCSKTVLIPLHSWFHPSLDLKARPHWPCILGPTYASCCFPHMPAAARPVRDPIYAPFMYGGAQRQCVMA